MEQLTKKQETNRSYYLKNREKILRNYKKWYSTHHEQALMTAAMYRQRTREKTHDGMPPKPPTTKELEDALPYELRIHIARLRKEYLSIHITERPAYEDFLKMKTIEIKQPI